jgi:hypothetical protein
MICSLAFAGCDKVMSTYKCGHGCSLNMFAFIWYEIALLGPLHIHVGRHWRSTEGPDDQDATMHPISEDLQIIMDGMQKHLVPEAL